MRLCFCFDVREVSADMRFILHRLTPVVGFPEVEHTVSERKILATNTNPFLVSLKYSFQSTDKIYFVLDYISGGELFVHLQVGGVLPFRLSVCRCLGCLHLSLLIAMLIT